jgi:hypothetical protein
MAPESNAAGTFTPVIAAELTWFSDVQMTLL